eukprot:5631597-Pyramimonas_sp.AAC.1
MIDSPAHEVAGYRRIWVSPGSATQPQLLQADQRSTRRPSSLRAFSSGSCGRWIGATPLA